MSNKVVSIKIRVTHTDLILKCLKDEDFIKSSLPYLVGVREGKITLRFTRMLLFHFEDTYDLLVTSINGSVNHVLTGERSNIKLTFSASANDLITATATYEGPRAWVVGSCLSKLVTTLIREAEARAREAAEVKDRETADYSEKLALVSWVSKLLMKSLLVKSEIVAIPKGGLVNYVENLVTEEILQKYRVVYVSGTSDEGTFRLLFANGSLVGTYVNLGGKEFVGDEKALNEFEGFTKVRVYGSMVKNLSELR